MIFKPQSNKPYNSVPYTPITFTTFNITIVTINIRFNSAKYWVLLIIPHFVRFYGREIIPTTKHGIINKPPYPTQSHRLPISILSYLNHSRDDTHIYGRALKVVQTHVVFCGVSCGVNCVAKSPNKCHCVGV
jgi:hypothetical protein